MQAPVGFVIRVDNGDNGEALRQYAERRLFFALRRFDHVVHRVTVRFEDLNGPKRGVDSRCAIAADLTNGRRIHAEATTAWPSASVTRAARRLGNAVRRELSRDRGKIQVPRSKIEP